MPLSHLLRYHNLRKIDLTLTFYLQLLVSSSRLRYSYVCQPLTYINNKDELRVITFENNNRLYLHFYCNYLP